VLAFLLARIAVRNVAGEALLHKMFKASRIIRELTVEVIDRVPQMGWNRLTAVHGKNSMPFVLRDVKG